jgi:hypothetical protein
MKMPADGWDRDEQETLRELEASLEQLRDRHAAEPPVELLRAAAADVLPAEVQERVARRIDESEWSRALVAGVSDEDCALDPEVEARLFARIEAAAGESRQRGSFWRWPAFAAAAACFVLLAGLLVWRSRSLRPEETGPAPVVAAAPSPAPSFHLPLDAPAVKLSVAVLTWRGEDEKNHLLADLKPGLDAFRNRDYKTADEELSKLAPRYPDSFDVRYYQGVSRLLANDPTGAIESLTAASRAADPSFVPAVEWYLAAAYERAGNTRAARQELTALCNRGAGRAADACAALQQIK